MRYVRPERPPERNHSIHMEIGHASHRQRQNGARTEPHAIGLIKRLNQKKDDPRPSRTTIAGVPYLLAAFCSRRKQTLNSPPAERHTGQPALPPNSTLPLG